MLDRLTLDQLRILVSVVETGSFSGAGRRLGRVQSAISQSILGLEDTLGVVLFDRSQRTPGLSVAGRAILAQARQVLAQADALRAGAAAMRAGLEPELRLSADNLFPNDRLVRGLHGLNQAFPQLQVSLYTEAIGAAETRLRSEAADLAFCALLPGTAGDLVAEPLLAIDMLPVVAASHPLAKVPPPIARETLQLHIQLILTDPLLGVGGPSLGVISPRVWRFVELGRRLEFLRAGLGWGNMPRHLVQSLVETGELIALDLEEPSLLIDRIPISAAWRRARPPGPAGRWLLDHIKAGESVADQT